jgi:hypothetical protein
VDENLLKIITDIANAVQILADVVQEIDVRVRILENER